MTYSRTNPPRVGYMLSSDLIRASSALPSNLKRSQTVHSLVYHFDLLALPPTGASNRSDDDSHPTEYDQSTDPHLDLAILLAGGDEATQCQLDHSKSTSQYYNHQGDGGNVIPLPSADLRSCLKTAGVILPLPATEDQLKAFHSATYVEVLLAQEAQQNRVDDEACGLVDDCFRFPALADHVRQISGASITAAKALFNDEADIVIHWDGGRHHAHKSRAAGFCYVNDVVLAILELRKAKKTVLTEERSASESQDEGPGHSELSDFFSGTYEEPRQPARLGFGARPEEILRAHQSSTSKGRERPRSSASPPARKRRTVMKRLERILYLDLDLHWGDGVEEAFRGSSSVLTLSIHNQAPGFYPTAPDTLGKSEDSEEEEVKQRSPAIDAHTLRLPLHPDASPKSWARIWASCVVPVMKAYEPEAIVVQCGLDGLAGDPMKQWNLDLRSILHSVNDVLQYATEHKSKVLLLGGGGYDTANAAKGWTALTALALGRLDLHVGTYAHSVESSNEVEDSVPLEAQEEAFANENWQAGEMLSKNETIKEPAVMKEEYSTINRNDSSLCNGRDEVANGKCLPVFKAEPADSVIKTSTSALTDKLTLQTPIPDTSPDWTLYSGAPTLDIPAGSNNDTLNDEVYLNRLEKYFAIRIEELKKAQRERSHKDVNSGKGSGREK